MVGRGGRSKGCDSCRQRHLKCDQAWPQCQRCRRDNVECCYPAAKFINVFQRPTQQHEPKQKRALDRKVRLAAGFPSLLHDDSVVVTHLKRTIFATPSDDPGWPGFDAFSIAGSSRPKSGGGGGGRSNDLALKCLVSLSESYYGCVRNDAPTSRKGQTQYIDCLRAVNEKLGARRPQIDRDTLLAVTILNAYEMLFCTVEDGWVNHGLGLAKLFEVAGTAVCRERTSFHIFQNMRFVMLLAALVTRTPTFLRRPEWQSAPWAARGARKNDMDRLQDILCDLPGLRCALPGAASEEGEHDVEDARAVYALARDILARLRAWFVAWQRHSSPTAFVVPAMSDDDDGAPKPWTTDLAHASLYAANCFCLYNTGVIIATQAALLAARPGDLAPGDAAVHLAAARQAGVDICRSIDYMLFRTHGTLGHLTVLVPLQKAYEVLGRATTPEGRWLEARHRQILSWTGNWRVAAQVLSSRAESVRVMGRVAETQECCSEG